MENEIIFTIAIFFIIAVLLIVLGYVIKKYKLASLIAGFDENKHNKEIVCKVVGNNLLKLGFIFILYLIIYPIVYKDPTGIIIFNMVLFIGIAIILVECLYKLNKYGKNKKQ